jgi:hypothetical protein
VLFHNLRKSRQNELERKFGKAVACEWIGNSESVADEHYLFANAADFAKAMEPVSATQKTTQPAPDKAGQEKTPALASAQNHSEKPSDSQTSGVSGWPLSESNRYALSGIGF